jgi:hypothetical protein
MIEPTITQNSALYLAHHKASKRKPFFERLGLVARKERIIIKLGARVQRPVALAPDSSRG